MQEKTEEITQIGSLNSLELINHFAIWIPVNKFKIPDLEKILGKRDVHNPINAVAIPLNWSNLKFVTFFHPAGNKNKITGSKLEGISPSLSLADAMEKFGDFEIVWNYRDEFSVFTFKNVDFEYLVREVSFEIWDRKFTKENGAAMENNEKADPAKVLFNNCTITYR